MLFDRAYSSAPSEADSKIHVDLALLLRQPLKALLPVLVKIEGWREATEGTLKVSQLSGAMTNLVYRCRYQRGDEKLFALARVFGNTPDDLFSREYEQMVFKTVARAGMGPRLLVSFDNGRIEEFYTTFKCLSAAQVAEPAVSRALAAAMSNFHFTSLLHLPPEEAKDPQVWSRLRGWLQCALELYGEAGLAEYGLENATAQIEAVEARIRDRHSSWLGFCHNDLQSGNIMLDAAALEHVDSPAVANGGQPCSGEAQGQTSARTQAGGRQTEAQRSVSRTHASRALSASLDLHEADSRDAKGQTLLPRSSSATWVSAPTTAIKLIDYEYAGMNCVAYDIANHWCEYAADYDTATPHILDMRRMPSPQSQAEFVEAYVASLSQVHSYLAARPNGLDTVNAKIERAQEAAGVNVERPLPEEAARALSTGEGALQALAAKLQAAARDYIPVSHVAWGLWGLIQAKSSSIDFGYISYATQRLQEFRRIVSNTELKHADTC